MDTRTTEDELIERAMELLPRFKRSMLRHIGGPPGPRACVAVHPGRADAGAKAVDMVAVQGVGTAPARRPR